MHSHLTLHRADFPDLIPSNAVPGDRLRFVVTAIVRRVEDDLVDVTANGDIEPRYLLGDTEVELLVVEARRTPETLTSTDR